MDYFVNYLLIFYMMSMGAFALYGIGLVVMGKTMGLKRLALLALTSGAIIAPLYLTPITHGVKLCLNMFFYIFMLYRYTGFGLFVCTGAVLSGLSLCILLEYAVHLYQSSRRISFDPSWLLRAIRVLPSALAGIVLAISGQYLLQRRLRRDWFAALPRNTDKEQLRVYRIVPLAQLYTAFMIFLVMASLAYTVPFFYTSFFSRLTLVILVGSILFCLYLTCNYFNGPGVFASPMDLVDLVILVPYIFVVLFHSGGPASPWRVLFIPLIITNALKRQRAFGQGGGAGAGQLGHGDQTQKNTPTHIEGLRGTGGLAIAAGFSHSLVLIGTPPHFHYHQQQAAAHGRAPHHSRRAHHGAAARHLRGPGHGR